MVVNKPNCSTAAAFRLVSVTSPQTLIKFKKTTAWFSVCEGAGADSGAKRSNQSHLIISYSEQKRFIAALVSPLRNIGKE